MKKIANMLLVVILGLGMGLGMNDQAEARNARGATIENGNSPDPTVPPHKHDMEVKERRSFPKDPQCCGSIPRTTTFTCKTCGFFLEDGWCLETDKDGDEVLTPYKTSGYPPYEPCSPSFSGEGFPGGGGGQDPPDESSEGMNNSKPNKNDQKDTNQANQGSAKDGKEPNNANITAREESIGLTDYSKGKWLAAFSENSGNIFQAWAPRSAVSAGVVNSPDNTLLTRLHARGNKLNATLTHTRQQAQEAHRHTGRASYVQEASHAQSTSHSVVQSNSLQAETQAPAAEPAVNDSGSPQVVVGPGPEGMPQPVNSQPWNEQSRVAEPNQGRTIQTGRINLTNQPKFTGQVMINEGNTLAAPLPLNGQPRLGGRSATGNAQALGVLR